MIELLTDPAAWLGLLTLIVLELVLGIDNLVFIAILAEKLPPHQRDRARIVGLSLAMLMRLGLLVVILNRTYGSVRGAGSNPRPYRNRLSWRTTMSAT